MFLFVQLHPSPPVHRIYQVPRQPLHLQPCSAEITYSPLLGRGLVPPHPPQSQVHFPIFWFRVQKVLLPHSRMDWIISRLCLFQQYKEFKGYMNGLLHTDQGKSLWSGAHSEFFLAVRECTSEKI